MDKEKEEIPSAVAKEDCPKPNEEIASVSKSPAKTYGGEALIKPEFILPKPIPDAVQSSRQRSESGDAPPRKKAKGQNKKRPRMPKLAADQRLCPSLTKENTECSYGDKCKFTHDIAKYMTDKQKDIGPICVNFNQFGKCQYGLECRFASAHIDKMGKNLVNAEIVAQVANAPPRVTNVLPKDLQMQLRKRTFAFERSEQYLKAMESSMDDGVGQVEKPSMPANGADASLAVDCVTKEDTFITPTIREKKTIDFSDKLYLAPLTTVGNLPFRRICKQFGADVTCSEMALAMNLLQGQQSEWALVKRHASEDLFGIQVCGAFPDTMTRCAELLNNTMSADFIDINIGCPIDLVFHKGGGCALMGRKTKFERIVKGMVEVSDIPITVKMRTGIYEKVSTAHTLIPNLRDWGTSLVTLHGRSREQRYTRKANWDYIHECAEVAKPMPLFGNGDVLSYEDANQRRSATGVSGLMIARGALIKPWIFTEIKEQRHWDISANERLDILQEYADFGLQHWGSDHKGVENTRRFLLEWLSFLHRYIPVGVLEVVPQGINDRPPLYFGRNDLETLMASPNSKDWIKISEMVLGPVPEGFLFLPKHKANSYA